MSGKEQQRAVILTGAMEGRLTAPEAAELMSLSERHLRRLRCAFVRDGPAALVHGNRGRKPAHALDAGSRERVITLAEGVYAGCNDQHLTELLAEREGIVLSRSSVRRILRSAGRRSPQRRRAPRHRARRERMPQAGMLLQVDGSRHQWLGPEGPWLTLLAAIDDATGDVPYAVFREQEDAQGYLLLLRGVVRRRGVPLALYSDRHTIFQSRADQPLTLTEQLAGGRQPTQVGRVLKELGVTWIGARSPQAKGRIERLWRTFQDRLVVELALAGITDIKAANRFLPGFLRRYNARFAQEADEPGLAYRPLHPALDLDRILSFRYQRVVARDNTVSLDGRLIQIPPGPRRRSYFAARVWVHEYLDGGLGVRYQDEWLVRGKGNEAAVVRARNRKPALPERPPVPILPLPLETSSSTTTASAGPPPARQAHPWRKWNPGYLKQRARTESLSS